MTRPEDAAVPAAVADQTDTDEEYERADGARSLLQEEAQQMQDQEGVVYDVRIDWLRYQ